LLDSLLQETCSMLMQRYFIQFAYWGKRFRGLQKQDHRPIKLHQLPEEEIRSHYEKDEKTVQGAIESGLWHILKPVNPVKLVTSCRTDTGVNALQNTGHFDVLLHNNSGYPIYPNPRGITKNLNSWLLKRNYDIRVNKTCGVPATFHCRHDVTSRFYLYKLAIFPHQKNLNDSLDRFHKWEEHPFPIKYRKQYKIASERNACVMSKLSLLERDSIFEFALKENQSFDFQLFKEALYLMKGTFNFSNFSKIQGLFKYKTVNGEKYVAIPRTVEERTREVKNIEVNLQNPPLSATIYPLYSENDINFIDVIIEGQSFLHNQVRRMIGLALAVATQKVDIEFVSKLLNNPDHGWDGKVTPAPARGLYLARVNYKEEALTSATDNSKVMEQLEKVSYDPDFNFKGERGENVTVCDKT